MVSCHIHVIRVHDRSDQRVLGVWGGVYSFDMVQPKETGSFDELSSSGPGATAERVLPWSSVFDFTYLSKMFQIKKNI